MRRRALLGSADLEILVRGLSVESAMRPEVVAEVLEGIDVLGDLVGVAGQVAESALLLFPGNGFGEPMNPDTLSSRMRNLMKLVGIRNVPLGTHVARHTMGSFLIRDAHTDPVTVSRRMGHARVSTTLDIYGHEDVDTARRAANTAARIFRREENKKG